ncbi:MAG TPA: response regulator, partial [Methylomirabilota bacterium]|nr:response regulator [Methylomirabilota bacterium]
MPIRMSARLAGVFILLVDDDPDARELLEYALSEAGGTVVTASTAAEALERFKASSPSIVVTDVAMPSLDGVWLCEQIRALPGGHQ